VVSFRQAQFISQKSIVKDPSTWNEQPLSVMSETFSWTSSSAGTNFQYWILDLASPGQLKLMQRSMGKQLSEASAAFKFGPPEGPNFFVPHGWEPIDIQGLLQTAARFKRSPAGLFPMAIGRTGAPGDFPWTGVCLFTKR
jgi:hypothetical protein